MARKKQPQNLWIKISFLFLIFCVIVFTNLYLSDYITDLVTHGFTVNNVIFSLKYMQNTGAAFSLMQEYTYVLIAFSVIALTILFAYIIRNAGTMSFKGIFWLTLMMSGIFCNLYERIMLGYVRDFINLNFINFPVFNFSDMLICTSVFAIIILLLMKTSLKQL